MRILALGNKELNSYITLEVLVAEYEENYSGIVFYDSEDNEWYIENITIQDCNWICRELAFNGFCDIIYL